MDVAVVSYNTRELLRRCLESVEGQEGLGRTVVADDLSSDGSVEMVRERFPHVHVVAGTVNRGFGTVSNAAVSACASPFVLLLNSDTVLQPGSLVALSEYLAENPRAAIVGPRLLNSDGSLQPSCFPFPGPINAFMGETGLGGLRRFTPILRTRHYRTWAHDAPRRVPWVRGAALALRRDAFLEAGGFDPSFFMYFEEVDLARRLTRDGWEVHFAPVTSIYHVGGASTRQQRAQMRVRYYESMERYYERHHAPWKRTALRAVLWSTMSVRLVRDRFRALLARDPDARAGFAADAHAWRQIMKPS